MITAVSNSETNGQGDFDFANHLLGLRSDSAHDNGQLVLFLNKNLSSGSNGGANVEVVKPKCKRLFEIQLSGGHDLSTQKAF